MIWIHIYTILHNHKPHWWFMALGLPHYFLLTPHFWSSWFGPSFAGENPHVCNSKSNIFPGVCWSNIPFYLCSDHLRSTRWHPSSFWIEVPTFVCLKWSFRGRNSVKIHQIPRKESAKIHTANQPKSSKMPEDLPKTHRSHLKSASPICLGSSLPWGSSECSSPSSMDHREPPMALKIKETSNGRCVFFGQVWTNHQSLGGTTFLTKTHIKIWGEFWIGIISAKKYLTVCCQLGATSGKFLRNVESSSFPRQMIYTWRLFHIYVCLLVDVRDCFWLFWRYALKGNTTQVDVHFVEQPSGFTASINCFPYGRHG